MAAGAVKRRGGAPSSLFVSPSLPPSNHDRRLCDDLARLSSSATSTCRPAVVLPLCQLQHQPAARVDRRPRSHAHGRSPLGERKVKLLLLVFCKKNG